MATLDIEQIFCSYDNPKGNADTERVMRTVKEELLWLNEFSIFEEAIGRWIEEDYNALYVHSSLGYLSPNEFSLIWTDQQVQEACVGGVCSEVWNKLRSALIEVLRALIILAINLYL